MPGRPLVLGGVDIGGNFGLLGHSDGDVLSHAAADGLLGAAGLKDIGEHFPDTDETWRGYYSLDILKVCAGMALERGWMVISVQMVMMTPLLVSETSASAIRLNLAGATGCPDSDVSLTVAGPLGPLAGSKGITAQGMVAIARSAWQARSELSGTGS